MVRPITLTIGQWADLSFEDICTTANSLGYDGLELSFRMIDPEKAAASADYCADVRETMEKHNQRTWAVSAHAIGKCVAEAYDPRLDALVPPRFRGKPEDIRQWAVDLMTMIPTAAKNLGCQTVTGFMGSPIWKYVYAFPPTDHQLIDEGYRETARLWTPILNEFARCGIRFALEVHPTEVAFDYYSAERLIKELRDHTAFGFNFDPSHLLWQGIDPALFLRDFSTYIAHVHMKDVTIRRDGRAGSLGSHLPFGDARRGWNFRSLGRGDVDFEEIVRALDDLGYEGPLSVEWEDNGMDRIHGARESIEYVRKLQFPSSHRLFDAAIKYMKPKGEKR